MSLRSARTAASWAIFHGGQAGRDVGGEKLPLAGSHGLEVGQGRGGRLPDGRPDRLRVPFSLDRPHDPAEAGQEAQGDRVGESVAVTEG